MAEPRTTPASSTSPPAPSFWIPSSSPAETVPLSPLLHGAQRSTSAAPPPSSPSRTPASLETRLQTAVPSISTGGRITLIPFLELRIPTSPTTQRQAWEALFSSSADFSFTILPSPQTPLVREVPSFLGAIPARSVTPSFLGIPPALKAGPSGTIGHLRSPPPPSLETPRHMAAAFSVHSAASSLWRTPLSLPISPVTLEVVSSSAARSPPSSTAPLLETPLSSEVVASGGRPRVPSPRVIFP